MSSFAPFGSSSNLPETEVEIRFITLTDISPNTAISPTVSFTFPQMMIADPLTSVGKDGSEPDNRAPWWPYFQQRHRQDIRFWVQGHMLNHNVHGPGIPQNLVPISNTLNTNMSAMVEERVKEKVKAGKILKYVVQAHWEGHRVSAGFYDPWRHPEAMRRACGMLGDGEGGSLLWGEQFAPTRLSWELYEYTNWHTRAYTAIAFSRYGHAADQWNNHFPHRSVLTSQATIAPPATMSQPQASTSSSPSLSTSSSSSSSQPMNLSK